jgi:hypothetical protein
MNRFIIFRSRAREISPKSALSDFTMTEKKIGHVVGMVRTA